MDPKISSTSPENTATLRDETERLNSVTDGSPSQVPRRRSARVRAGGPGRIPRAPGRSRAAACGPRGRRGRRRRHERREHANVRERRGRRRVDDDRSNCVCSVSTTRRISADPRSSVGWTGRAAGGQQRQAEVGERHERLLRAGRRRAARPRDRAGPRCRTAGAATVPEVGVHRDDPPVELLRHGQREVDRGERLAVAAQRAGDEDRPAAPLALRLRDARADRPVLLRGRGVGRDRRHEQRVRPGCAHRLRRRQHRVGERGLRLRSASGAPRAPTRAAPSGTAARWGVAPRAVTRPDAAAPAAARRRQRSHGDETGRAAPATAGKHRSPGVSEVRRTCPSRAAFARMSSIRLIALFTP